MISARLRFVSVTVWRRTASLDTNTTRTTRTWTLSSVKDSQTSTCSSQPSSDSDLFLISDCEIKDCGFSWTNNYFKKLNKLCRLLCSCVEVLSHQVLSVPRLFHRRCFLKVTATHSLHFLSKYCDTNPIKIRKIFKKTTNVLHSMWANFWKGEILFFAFIYASFLLRY